MDNTSRVTGKKNRISNLAVDGMLYGLASGFMMFISLSIFGLFSGETPGDFLVRFSTNQLTSPLQGLLSHLAVSATYGVIFGILIQPMLIRFAATKFAGLLAGAAYGAILLLLAQGVILPGTDSPMSELLFWQWALAHEVYGITLGGLFTKNSFR